MKLLFGLMTVSLLLLYGCGSDGNSPASRPASSQPAAPAGPTEIATFAGGCFWCVEAAFEKVPGVIDVVSGYTGGKGLDPTYKNYHDKGHVEAVLVTYDSACTTYARLLDVFWRQINPTDAGGQFADRGAHYRSAIFYHDEKQKRLAEQSKKDLAASGKFSKPIATEILPASTFYEAEEYHQDYYRKSAAHYKRYRSASGRDAYLAKVWGSDPAPKAAKETAMEYPTFTDEELKKKLSPLQYRVTQKEGTEPAFNNEYWDNHREGIYVDVVSGEPLFSSLDKYKSGTGWPSFTRPLEPGNIVAKTDRSLFMTRTEVRSLHADSHVGHLFDDGPAPTGLRYCMNSAALRFIPKEDLEREGYAQYLKLFDK